jgi:hypothetical protein
MPVFSFGRSQSRGSSSIIMSTPASAHQSSALATAGSIGSLARSIRGH